MSWPIAPFQEEDATAVLPAPADRSVAPLPRGSARAVLREVLETLLFTLLIFFLVRSVILNFKVEGSSMEPSLHTGQYIIVNRIVYFHLDLNFFRRLLPGGEGLGPNLFYPFQMPQRGDIVVFEYPRDTSRDFIKRVIGLPGETVEIRNGQVWIDGLPLDEPYLTAAARSQTGNMPPTKVPLDAVFVMGDNRGNSSDSRSWGALPLHRIVGRAWLTYWPQQYWGLIPQITPTLASP